MFPNDYLKKGYYDENGNLLREIIVEHAREVANQLSNDGMNSAALRRYYSRLIGIKNKLISTKDFEKVRPKIYELIPRVTYDHSRKIVPYSFRLFIEKNLELACKNDKDFLGFVLHCQSLVCFFKEKDSRDQNNDPNRKSNRDFNGKSQGGFKR
jgi:hypothetical protein